VPLASALTFIVILKSEKTDYFMHITWDYNSEVHLCSVLCEVLIGSCPFRSASGQNTMPSDFDLRASRVVSIAYSFTIVTTRTILTA
jgi:hypothetical protein